jgi:hypothetical protein
MMMDLWEDWGTPNDPLWLAKGHLAGPVLR